jgi:hypothetical protein
MAFTVMKMCIQIDDPDAIPSLLRIVEGMAGQANNAVRREACGTLASLTRISFLTDRRNPPLTTTMMSPDAADIILSQKSETAEATFKAVADNYRRWLKGEGSDRAQWTTLAEQRARAALRGDDTPAIMNGLAFLTGIGRTLGVRHDHTPNETLALIAKLEPTTNPERQTRAALAIASYGPAARPYAGMFIQSIQKRTSRAPYQALSNIGGEAAIAFLVGKLPELWMELDRANVPLDGEFYSIDNSDLRETLLAYRACRFAIERWAGRIFDTDQQIAAWWNNARGRTQREWLLENIKSTCADGDAGNAEAQYIARAVLPDLPAGASDLPFMPFAEFAGFPAFDERSPSSSRSQWLAANEARLVYDEVRSCFVLH